MLKKIYKLGELTFMKQYKEQGLENHVLEDLFWECTLTCNAKCKHCGSSAETRKYDGELTTVEIKDAFHQIAEDMDASKILINVTGGEPLVRKDLCEVMEYASHELGFHWGMTTNGILLTEEMIEKLRKAKMETISISIDGLEKTHNEFRGVPNSYQIIMDNIRNLKKASFVNHIQVTTVVHKENKKQLEELYKEILDLGIDSWRLMSMDPIGRANENETLMLNGAELKELLDFIKKKRKERKIDICYGCPRFSRIRLRKGSAKPLLLLPNWYPYCKYFIQWRFICMSECS